MDLDFIQIKSWQTLSFDLRKQLVKNIPKGFRVMKRMSAYGRKAGKADMSERNEREQCFSTCGLRPPWGLK